MLQKAWLGFTVVALVAVLLLDQILPTFAQTPADTLATREEITIANVRLGKDGAPQDLVGSAVTRQEPVKTIPMELDGDESSASRYLVFLPAVLAASDIEANNEVSAATYWYTIKYESFNDSFPNEWQVYDCNGNQYGGEEYWGAANYVIGSPDTFTTNKIAWVARGGTKGMDPRYYGYPNQACAWMIYGPFSLSSVSQARMTFKFWNESELTYDVFSWMAYCNGMPYFSGLNHSGKSDGWDNITLDLGNIPGYAPGTGSCLGNSNVWVAFRFISNANRIGTGAFVDDVVIQKAY